MPRAFGWEFEGNCPAVIVELTCSGEEIEHESHPIQVKAELDRQDGEGWTALHWAANGGHDRVVEMLKAKAEVDKQNEHGWTALHWAAYGGRDRVVEILLKAKAEVGKLNREGETAIQIARRHEHDTTVHIIERRMEDIQIVEASDREVGK